MNQLLSSSRSATATLNLISSLTFQSPKQFSSTTTSIPPKWNSRTNTIITHPLLLAMESCTSMLQLKQIQAHMTENALITHTFPASRVLAFCALSNSGDMNHAHLLFSQLQNPNTCRMQGNVEVAKIAAPRLLELDPEDSGVYVLLASICGSGRRWGDVKVARRMMRERRVKKIPGRSMIELAGEFHEFLAGDESHPQSEGIYNALDQLYAMYV